MKCVLIFSVQYHAIFRSGDTMDFDRMDFSSRLSLWRRRSDPPRKFIYNYFLNVTYAEFSVSFCTSRSVVIPPFIYLHLISAEFIITNSQHEKIKIDK